MTNIGNEAYELRNMRESFKFGCESFFLLFKFDFLLIGGLPLIPINQLNSVSRKLSFVTQGRKTYWINWNHLKYIKGSLKATCITFLQNCNWKYVFLIIWLNHSHMGGADNKMYTVCHKGFVYHITNRVCISYNI